jgi:HK97 family phage prohead protease
MSKEIRTLIIKDLRAAMPEGMDPDKMPKMPMITGHAAVFNQETVIGGWFREMIMPGAFAQSIGEDDVRALFNHNPDCVLGRNMSGTLRLKEDETGLAVEIDPPDTMMARDCVALIQRGDISQMSFSFRTVKEEWEYGPADGMDLRRLKQCRLYDVSAVTFPAYEGTDLKAAQRSHDEWKKQNSPEPSRRSDTDTRRKRLELKTKEVCNG